MKLERKAEIMHDFKESLKALQAKLQTTETAPGSKFIEAEMKHCWDTLKLVKEVTWREFYGVLHGSALLVVSCFFVGLLTSIGLLQDNPLTFILGMLFGLPATVMIFLTNEVWGRFQCAGKAYLDGKFLLVEIGALSTLVDSREALTQCIVKYTPEEEEKFKREFIEYLRKEGIDIGDDIELKEINDPSIQDKE